MVSGDSSSLALVSGALVKIANFLSMYKYVLKYIWDLMVSHHCVCYLYCNLNVECVVEFFLINIF